MQILRRSRASSSKISPVAINLKSLPIVGLFPCTTVPEGSKSNSLSFALLVDSPRALGRRRVGHDKSKPIIAFLIPNVTAQLWG